MNNAPANTMLKSDLDFDANVNLAPQNTAQLGAQQNVKKSIKSLGVMRKARHTNNRGVFSIKEVADYLGVGRNTIYKLIYSNQLISFRIGNRRLISKQEVYDFLIRAQDNAKELASKGDFV